MKKVFTGLLAATLLVAGASTTEAATDTTTAKPTLSPTQTIMYGVFVAKLNSQVANSKRLLKINEISREVCVANNMEILGQTYNECLTKTVLHLSKLPLPEQDAYFERYDAR